MGHPSISKNGEQRPEGAIDPAELARIRQGAYRLFSQTLLYPDEGRLENLANAARELDWRDETWSAFRFSPQWTRFLRSLEELPLGDPVPIQNEYVSSFSVNRAGVPCPIYESAYLDGGMSLIPLVLTRLEMEYAELGLANSPTLKEPPDHVAVELELMSILCGREADCWLQQDYPGVLDILQKQQGFLRRHLDWWFPEFARKITLEDPDSMFVAVAEAASALLAHDRETLVSMIERLKGMEQVSPSGQAGWTTPGPR